MYYIVYSGHNILIRWSKHTHRFVKRSYPQNRHAGLATSGAAVACAVAVRMVSVRVLWAVIGTAHVPRAFVLTKWWLGQRNFDVFVSLAFSDNATLLRQQTHNTRRHFMSEIVTTTATLTETATLCAAKWVRWRRLSAIFRHSTWNRQTALNWDTRQIGLLLPLASLAVFVLESVNLFLWISVRFEFHFRPTRQNKKGM